MLITFSAILVEKIFISSEPVIDNSVGIWFDRMDPDLIAYKEYNDTFGEKEWSVLLLETESIFNTEFLEDLDKVTQQISKLKHVVKVTSITNVRDNFTSDDGALNYNRIYSEQVVQNDLDMKKFIRDLKRNPIFERNLILRDNDRFTALLIQNDNLIYEQSSYRIDLVDSIREILNGYNSIKDHALAGTTVVNAELNRASKRDVFIFYGLITVLLTLISIYILKNPRNLIVMFGVVLTSSLPAMGLLAALNIAYNMITVMLPTILIALSVAGVIHIITEFHIARKKRNSESAMEETLQRLFKPTLWTTLTTVAGFISFSTSTVFPVFQLGIFAALGLVLACIGNLVIAPILLIVLWPDRLTSPGNVHEKTYINPLRGSIRLRNGILLFIPVLLLPVLGLGRLEVDTNYIKFFSSSYPLSQSYKLIETAGFAQNPIVIQLNYPENQPYSSSSQLKGTIAFEAALKNLPEVVKVLSASDFLNEINVAFNGKDAEKLEGYQKAQIEQLLLLGELSGNDDLTDFILGGAYDVQILTMTQYLSSRELDEFKKKLYKLQAQHLPNNLTMKITGTTTLWANMDTHVSHTQFFSLLVIFLFLLVFLPIIFGSLKLGLVGLMVNVLPLAVTLGCMSLLDIKINIATALIGGISLGVVVDDTIHFISRIIQNQKSGQAPIEAVQNAIQTIGKSIIYTTLILIVGFSCMATSNFLPSAHFGIFISLSIFLALLLDLICLPLILEKFPQLTTLRKQG